MIPPHMLNELERNCETEEYRQAAAVTRKMNDKERFERLRAGAGGAARLSHRRHYLLSSACTALSAAITRGPSRLILDGQANTTSQDDLVVLREGDPDVTENIAANEAYESFGDGHGYLSTVYRRNSYDDRGATMEAVVHYGWEYLNAFWDGKRVSYGDGDGWLFNRFTISPVINTHELWHAVIQYLSPLRYQGQAGALNEHVADLFGVLSTRYTRRADPGAEKDWLIGRELFTNRVKGRAIRDMAHPGTAYDDPYLGRDPQPAHMSGYVTTDADNGGVHINSGIPNRAAYLAVESLHEVTGVTVGRVWYDTLLRGVDPDATFHQFAAATMSVARTHGRGTLDAVRDAWSQVGIEP